MLSMNKCDYNHNDNNISEGSEYNMILKWEGKSQELPKIHKEIKDWEGHHNR